ncbi:MULTISPECIES: hypothetical protein [unclassified Microbacterium]|uniref:hypothetical protein n=1 Tax=unclassified Microbacterium TaxID=2609290 RepID=UPI003C2C2770
MPITHTDITADEELGRRVLARARVIAPCLDSLDKESEEGKTAIAIIKAVIAELPSAGEARLRTVSRNGSSASFAEISSAFDGDATVSLRALCGSAAQVGLPRGRFPERSAASRSWPEERYP